ncbi:hypothetical protein WK90_27070 [Burkholderia cepacia]|nr:hypothetical protein WK83_18900 [Burkholderia cepacia]KVV63365.1 hypothetical protein WK84_26510 [Burkholderia cepacia]KVV70003.1 hypothetical protein WK85_17585 [Burkholderia cepacia]KVV81165.1 hypothetical protein WK86_02720 [Burkholderia cepacia]KVV82939.1 hypothetical protein WK87_24090 [Burkholderia cepacia]
MANAGFYGKARNNVPIGGGARCVRTWMRRLPERQPAARQRNPIDRYDRHVRASHGSDARDTGDMLAAQRKSRSFPDA